jgi:hypothetical protein
MGARHTAIARTHHGGVIAILLVLTTGGAGVTTAVAQGHLRPDGGLDLEAIQATIDSLGLRFTVATNEFTDLTAQERQRFGGWRQPTDEAAWHGVIPISGRDLPATLDWRDHAGGNYVTGVRHQGPCGACWAFAPVALLESWLLIAQETPGLDLDLSEQYVVSCIAGPHDCADGDQAAALDFLVREGTPTEPCFPYVAQDTVPCDASCENTPLLLEFLNGWSWVTAASPSIDIEAIKDALLDGPVTTTMRIHHSFYAYSDGVYSAHGSPSTLERHIVLIVGWDDAEQCWLAKNSWGRFWGEDGFFRISYDSGCAFGRWTVRALDCLVAPPLLVFDVPVIGQAQTLTFTVNNTTDQALSDVVTWSHEEFTVEPTSYSLQPGEQQQFWVTYAPATYGDTSCEIETGALCGRVVCQASGPAPSTELVAWGNNLYGQCNVPILANDYVAVAAGDAHSLALLADGTVVAWGSNAFGQCDVLPSSAGYVAIAAGNWHSLALEASGTILAWGNDDFGQCTVPEPNTGFMGIAAGRHFSLGLKSDGSIVGWGSNFSGQCDVPEPNAGFTAVAAGAFTGLGLRGDGSVVVWGSGSEHLPEPNTDFVAIAAGRYHGTGIRSDGVIARWGILFVAPLPTPNSGFVAISAFEAYHNIALRADGTIATWGNLPEHPMPSSNANYLAVAAGDRHFLAIRGTQTVSLLPPDDDAPALVVPAGLAIDRVAPNPFNPVTTIWFDLPRAGTATLTVHDLRGRLVRTLWQGPLASGRHLQAWDGLDGRGGAAPSGVYLVRLLVDGGSHRTVKITLAR